MYEIPLKAKVVVRCPKCNARVCDVIQGTNGYIEIKCPECKKISRIKLSFRLRRMQRSGRLGFYNYYR